MNDTFRYVLFVILMLVILLLQPIYLKWLGYESDPLQVSESQSGTIVSPLIEKTQEIKDPVSFIPESMTVDYIPESLITLVTPLYTVTITNLGGGSIADYTLTQKVSGKYKYFGGFDAHGFYQSHIPVSLIAPSDKSCQPCLAYFDDHEDQYHFINQPFQLSFLSASKDTLFLDQGQSLQLEYVLYDKNGVALINKTVSFFSDNYISHHEFAINEDVFDYTNNIELLWSGGLRPTEEKGDEDVQYGSGIISQGGELEDIQITSPDKNIDRKVFIGQTDWAALRTKYFLSALLPDSPGSFASLSAKNMTFGPRKQTPVYNMSIGYPLDVSSFASRLYLGPLDIDFISLTNTSLGSTMNWGWTLIRPISRGILWVLKYMHNALHLNYGLVLLLFAILVRIITGPLTKKSFESSQKMQKIQPEIKKMQEKYKKDPQRLNRETMGMYKKHGVNPLGGCLPMLLQMPLLMALFVVFRSTIEFRGQAFVFWITDLSKPDIIFSLPFNVPIYGDGVAILPLIMGITLFMTMRMSSATMDKSQKPVMYFMNGFFILLFNTFPSGLNLYYTAYNVMSFLQQRGIKSRISS